MLKSFVPLLERIALFRLDRPHPGFRFHFIDAAASLQPELLPLLPPVGLVLSFHTGVLLHRYRCASVGSSTAPSPVPTAGGWLVWSRAHVPHSAWRRGRGPTRSSLPVTSASHVRHGPS